MPEILTAKIIKTVVVTSKRAGVSRPREEVVTGTYQQIGTYLAQVALNETYPVTVTVRAVTHKQLN
jgi:hypothetical protein